ncbi:MAG: alpha/beta hydrolase [Thermoanaerobaculia bacterium]
MSETLRSAFDRVIGRENRRSAVRRGKTLRIPFESKILGNQRDLTIYLPPGYDEREDRRYPVLYMQDGQNLFDGRRAFNGNPWRLGEAVDDAVASRAAEPLIIVGIDNTGPARIDEYTPTKDEGMGGGRADDYGRMIIEEIKPVIDELHRTHPDPENTAIGGSSLGGLVSLYLALRHPNVFRRAAVMSPSVWWNGRAILAEVERIAHNDRPRIWLDIGWREGREALNDTRALHERLLAKGWNEKNYRYHEEKKGEHSEHAWAHRSPLMLEFLFGTE